MVLKDNLDYWKHSLQNPEAILDEYYFSDELIIRDNVLLEKAKKLRELIIAYCVLTEERESPESKRLCNRIFKIVTSINNIQYHEFIAFWKVLDLSFSVFKQLPNQKEVLEQLLKSYCKKRRKQYDLLGYSNITIQALYDLGSSRKKGNSGNVKLSDLFASNITGVKLTKSFTEFNNTKRAYCFVDKGTGGKEIFRNFCINENVKYAFGKKYQNKLFDVLLKVDGIFLLIEAKHMKEGGGAQSKQVVEVIDFIGYTEVHTNIHYVTFMDGIYFNRFSITSKTIGKKKTNVNSILKNLKNHKRNFFVNTAGLIEILKDIN